MIQHSTISTERLRAIRTDEQERNGFLHDLAQQHRVAIANIARKAGDVNFDAADATQVFLLTANRAIDSAHEQDDGRGQNDPAAWAAWRGLNGVREAVRSIRGREDRSPRRLRDSGAIRNALSLDASPRDTGTYASTAGRTREEHTLGDRLSSGRDEIAAVESCLFLQDFLASLRPEHRSVAMLYVYGHDDQGHVMACCCRPGDPKHSVVRDVAGVLGRSEAFVFKALRAIREAAMTTWGIEAP